MQQNIRVSMMELGKDPDLSLKYYKPSEVMLLARFTIILYVVIGMRWGSNKKDSIVPVAQKPQLSTDVFSIFLPSPSWFFFLVGIPLYVSLESRVELPIATGRGAPWFPFRGLTIPHLKFGLD